MPDMSEEALQAHREQLQEMDARIAEQVQASDGSDSHGAALQELIDQRNEVQRAASRMDLELNPGDAPPE